MADQKDGQSKSVPSKPRQQKFVMGIIFLVLAFLGVVVIFYFLLENYRSQSANLEAYKEQVTAAKIKNNALEQKASELAVGTGRAVRVDYLVEEARNVYKGSAQETREGYLWVDRSGESWIVTLGVLQGVESGSRLSVLEGQDVIDTVIVQTPMDVISYVQPSVKLKNQFNRDYFRVVLQK